MEVKPKSKGGENIGEFKLELGDGSLLLMQGEMQKFWLHRIPLDPSNEGTRINLTYRVVKGG